MDFGLTYRISLYFNLKKNWYFVIGLHAALPFTVFKFSTIVSCLQIVVLDFVFLLTLKLFHLFDLTEQLRDVVSV